MRAGSFVLGLRAKGTKCATAVVYEWLLKMVQVVDTGSGTD